MDRRHLLKIMFGAAVAAAAAPLLDARTAEAAPAPAMPDTTGNAATSADVKTHLDEAEAEFAQYSYGPRPRYYRRPRRFAPRVYRRRPVYRRPYYGRPVYRRRVYRRARFY
jgi:hypothetical protein